MQLTGNTLLITGGASGIGLTLAQRFLQLGNTVIVCGRDSQKLAAAKSSYPSLHTVVADLTSAGERDRLATQVCRDFPNLNVLVNNAGIQTYPFLGEAGHWEKTALEIETNFAAPIHLNSLFAAHLAKQPAPAILNITSGLSHVPLTKAPVYSATKAALHSYTLTLRQQLQPMGIEVIEIAPPMVDTDLGGPGLHTQGMSLQDFADAVFAGLEKQESEIAVGFAAKSAHASRAERDGIFKQMNAAYTR